MVRLVGPGSSGLGGSSLEQGEVLQWATGPPSSLEGQQEQGPEEGYRPTTQ